MSYAIIPVALNLILSVMPLASASAAAPEQQPSVSESSSAATAGSDDCQVELDQAALLKNMVELVGDNVGSWVEYAPMRKGKTDLTAVTRFSFIKDASTQGVIVEMWLDKLGEIAVRSRPLADGGVANELKQSDNVYLIPDKNNEDDPASSRQSEIKKASCELRKVIEKKVKDFATAGKDRTKLTTSVGTFDCIPLALATPGGNIVVFYSEEAPVLNVASLTMPDGNSFQIVASGQGAYSSFPPGADPVPLDRVLGVLKGITDEANAEKEKAKVRRNLNEGKSSSQAGTASETHEPDGVGDGRLYGKDDSDDLAKVNVTKVR